MSNIKEDLIDINRKLAEYLKLGFHVPGATVVSDHPEFMRPSIRIVEIANDEVYSVSGGKYAFGRIAIQKFADAGRIELKVLGTPVVRGNDVARYSAIVSGERFEFDGSPKRLQDEKTYDLSIREDEMRLKYTEKVEKENPKWSPDQKRSFIERSVRKVMIEKQKFATEMSITGAQARVVSKMLGLKPVYTLAELNKPFVIVSMTPVVDMADPDIKRMVTAHMLGVRETLYASPSSVPYTSLPSVAQASASGSAAEFITGPSVSEFSECPHGTKVRILQRMLLDASVKAKLTGLDDSSLTSLYGQRMAA